MNRISLLVVLMMIAPIAAHGTWAAMEKPGDGGSDDTVTAELQYDRRPTQDDVDLLKSAYGVTEAYIYSNWDAILVHVKDSDLADLATAPDVVAMTEIGYGKLDLATSTRTIRAVPEALVADGYDHNLAAHSAFGMKGEGAVIAILDTGVDNNHLSLHGSLVNRLDAPSGTTFYGGADVRANLEVIGCVDPPDHYGHGTHVAGIALGRGAGDVAPGVAPEARMVDIAIDAITIQMNSDLIRLEDLALALDWLLDYNAGRSCYGDPGADTVDVLSVSLSLQSSSPGNWLNRKFTDVVRSGVTVVFSAGNAGSSGLTKGVEGAILVANSDDRDTVRRGDDLLQCSSSRGPRTSDRDADANDEAMPHVAAPGTSIYAPLHFTAVGGTYKSGTSMSAPHVSGVAALMLQANSSLRPVYHEEYRDMGNPGAVPVRDLLIQTAEYRNETESADCPADDFRTAMFDQPWNDAWGYGLVDAYEAVRLAVDG